MAFAVIDFETTGLVPERGDRVIEIGVVLVDDGGRTEREWTTLVNPRRDVSASHIHGLRAGDLFDAPEFDAVADQVLELTAGRTVVAHNATFDMRFLHAELARAGYATVDRPRALCSMKWCGRLVGPAKLQHACEALGVPLTNAHAALPDARATAGLLAHLMRRAMRDPEWTEDVDLSRMFVWPSQRGTPPAQPVMRGEQRKDPRTWLDKVLSAAWIPGLPEDEAAYLLVLDRALLDRQISRSEAKQLVDVARQSRLSGSTVARLHRNYLRSIAQEALSDGVIVDSERTDLLEVAAALGLPNEDLIESLAWARNQQRQLRAGKFALAPGDRVVFTGEVSRPRDEWLASIVAAGLTSGSVTKSTKLVVAADPDSLSGKAAKAQQYSIPIIDEATFERLFEAYLAARLAA